MGTFGKSSNSKSTSNYSVDNSTTSEDRKVALQGSGNLAVGERSTIDYRVNGFTGKDVGDLLAGITHDSSFAQGPGGAGGGGAGGTAASAAPSMLGGFGKSALYVGAGVLVLGLVLFLANRR